jgi:aminopeptidase N
MVFFVSIVVVGQVDLRLMRQYEMSIDYWKNHQPHAGYWQQDVHYAIKAEVDDKKLQIIGEEELIYVNNSPDTLYEVFFHLYQNAFQPNSYYHQLHRSDGRKVVFSTYEKKGLGTTIDAIESLSGIDSIHLDNTILFIQLKRPILPGQKSTFKIDFTTYFGTGSLRRRLKVYKVEGGNLHFNLAHWYPRIAVYDQKFGWNTYQHLDKEFYGDFGTFDVKLTFPEKYIVDGTGNLANRNVVLPDSLRKVLDFKNYKHRGDKSAGDTLTLLFAKNSQKKKTWHFKATKVHDVAYCADPTFRIDEEVYKGTSIVALAEEKHVPSWVTAATFTKQVIQTYSEDFYPYPHPKIIVADANDGMEYPMLTMNRGGEPGYRDLLAHELGHNWFQGMIGTNETYRAFMDEGFTQFLTMWSLVKIDGDTMAHSAYGKHYYKRHKIPHQTKNRKVFDGYIYSVLNGNDAELNTHSSEFGCGIRHDDGYGHVYYKAASMLLSLQNVLGDELFLQTVHTYVEKYRFAHPYPEDFRNHVISFTKRDLNWFFDQWLESEEELDYAVKKVKRLGDSTYAITLKRIGNMEMPLDIKIETLQDTSYFFHVPNRWNNKTTKAKVLPRWEGLGEVQREYTFEVVIPEGIYNVIIDPNNMQADINLLNNSKITPVKIKWNTYLTEPLNRNEYVIKSSPKLWYNSYDGVKIGFNLEGDYYKSLHKFNLDFWMNTGLWQGAVINQGSLHSFDDLNASFQYETPIRKLGKHHHFSIKQSYLVGIYHSKNAWIYKEDKWELDLSSVLYTSYDNDMINYQFSREHWNPRSPNHSFNLSFERVFKSHGYYGKLNLVARTTAFSTYDFSYFDTEFKNLFRAGRGVFRSRVFTRIGRGNNWAPEAYLYLAGASPEEMYDSQVYQAAGLIQRDWMEYGANTSNVHMGGGLNLRGYVGYLAPEIIGNVTVNSFRGNSGAAINLEYDFSRYLSNQGKMRYFSWETYLFGDAGMINTKDNELSLSQIRADAGLGGYLKIKKYWLFQTMQPTVMRVDFPFWINRLPAVENNYWDFRWIIGLNRTF